VDYSQRLATRVRILQPSATVELNERAAQLAKEGKDVIALAAGEPDFPPPAYVLRETKKALTEGHTHYTSSMGMLELRQTIAEKLKADNGLTYNPATEIIVTPGAKQGILYTCLAFLNRDDEVISPEPGWVSYKECATLAEAKYVPVPTKKEDNFRISREALEMAASPRSRLLLVNTPCNPTGRVLTLRELEDIAAFAKERDLIVLSDEIYEKLVYDRHKHISIASLPGMWERTITLNGYAKMYAMTGYRLGYAAAPAGIIKELNKIQQHSATCPTAFAQKGAAGSYGPSQPAVRKMLKAFKERRKLMVEGLAGIKGLRVIPPEGSFYMWLDCTAVTNDSKALSRRLLEEVQLALTPGVAFGACGEGFLRLSFATSTETLTEACRRIRTAFEKM
jgi:aspartate aminotransferase